MLTPSNHHLFWSLRNPFPKEKKYIGGMQILIFRPVTTEVFQWYLTELPEKWQNVIHKNAQSTLIYSVLLVGVKDFVCTDQEHNVSISRLVYKTISKMLPDGNEWHDIYHNFPIFEALTCVVRLVEMRFPAESRREPMGGKVNDDICVIDQNSTQFILYLVIAF